MTIILRLEKTSVKSDAAFSNSGGCCFSSKGLGPAHTVRVEIWLLAYTYDPDTVPLPVALKIMGWGVEGRSVVPDRNVIWILPPESDLRNHQKSAVDQKQDGVYKTLATQRSLRIGRRKVLT